MGVDELLSQGDGTLLVLEREFKMAGIGTLTYYDENGMSSVTSGSDRQ